MKARDRPENVNESHPLHKGEGRGEGEDSITNPNAFNCPKLSLDPDKKNAQPDEPAARVNTKQNYCVTCPVRPFFCKAAITSFSLKSPVTSKEVAPLVAVLPVTPETPLSALFTALTQDGQHR